jgi:hypothetical protein
MLTLKAIHILSPLQTFHFAVAWMGHSLKRTVSEVSCMCADGLFDNLFSKDFFLLASVNLFMYSSQFSSLSFVVFF